VLLWPATALRRPSRAYGSGMGMTTGQVSANGVDFTYLEIGTGPLALCLHGFPDTAHTWRHLLPALADAGYRAVAPFMRGYAPTSVAADGRYQSGVLGQDALALHEVLSGDEQAVVIGHDWGAMGAYGAAGYEPARWRRCVGMAVPPAGAVARAFLTYTQLQRSWYMFFFQHPLSDLVVGADDLAFIDRLWADWSPGYDPADDLPNVKASLRDPANLQAALGYYQATIGAGYKDTALDALEVAAGAPLTIPTLYLHGTDDGAIGVEVADGTIDALPDGSRVEIVEDTGHFLHLEKPGAVNAMILEFLR
jgi:pimeloyl-ACP methyl ester carboxylesterase